MGRMTQHILAESSCETRDWAREDIGTPSMTCMTRIDGESLYSHSKFQHNASSRPRDTEKGHGRADVPHPWFV